MSVALLVFRKALGVVRFGCWIGQSELAETADRSKTSQEQLVKALTDVSRASDELLHCQQLHEQSEKQRKLLDTQLKDAEAKLDSVQAENAYSYKKVVEKLEQRVRVVDCMTAVRACNSVCRFSMSCLGLHIGPAMSYSLMFCYTSSEIIRMPPHAVLLPSPSVHSVTPHTSKTQRTHSLYNFILLPHRVVKQPPLRLVN